MRLVSFSKRFHIQRSLEAEISRIFREAREQSLTHAQLLDLRQKRIFNHPLWERLGARVHEYLRGYYSAQNDLSWRNDCVNVMQHRGVWYCSKMQLDGRELPPGFLLWHENYDGHSGEGGKVVWIHSGKDFFQTT